MTSVGLQIMVCNKWRNLSNTVGPPVNSWETDEDELFVDESLEQMQCEDLLEQYPNQMSNGTQRRP